MCFYASQALSYLLVFSQGVFGSRAKVGMATMAEAGRGSPSVMNPRVLVEPSSSKRWRLLLS